MHVNLADAEVHNEMLKWTVILGGFGLIAILLIYFVSFAPFVWNCGPPESVKRIAGMLGACFVA